MKLTKLLFVFCLLLLASLPLFSQTNLPTSREAIFIESYSPTEVNIRAKGIGADVDAAENDARKCAVYFVLFNMTDKVLQTSAEEAAFTKMQEEFFNTANISNYITFMGSDIISRVKTSAGVKIEKLVRVNKQKMVDYLTQNGILVSKEAMQAATGNPFIMVLPEVKKGESPIAALQNDPNLKKAAEVIEAFLTNRKYDVQVPEQADNLNELAVAQTGAKGVEDDISYMLALSIGSDVYITYNVQVVASSMGKKAVVGCRAYETTTARLLGTETGYSPERPTAMEAGLIEEAMNDAIDKVLARINAYWKEDLKNGRQYKVIFKITGKFDDPQELGDLIDDVLKGMTTKKKLNVQTEKTLDYIIWQNKFEDTKEMFRALTKGLDANKDFKGSGAKVKRLNVNRKMIILEVLNG
jgi:hypothetical protein